MLILKGVQVWHPTPPSLSAANGLSVTCNLNLILYPLPQRTATLCSAEDWIMNFRNYPSLKDAACSTRMPVVIRIKHFWTSVLAAELIGASIRRWPLQNEGQSNRQTDVLLSPCKGSVSSPWNITIITQKHTLEGLIWRDKAASLRWH